MCNECVGQTIDSQGCHKSVCRRDISFIHRHSSQLQGLSSIAQAKVKHTECLLIENNEINWIISEFNLYYNPMNIFYLSWCQGASAASASLPGCPYYQPLFEVKCIVGEASHINKKNRNKIPYVTIETNLGGSRMTFKKELVRCKIPCLAQFHVDDKIWPMLNTYLAVCRLKG